ncbi:MAG: hypothetical protein RI953_360 [Pseudomonadota bacterium]
MAFKICNIFLFLSLRAIGFSLTFAFSLLVTNILVVGSAFAESKFDWQDRVIYFTLIDRFSNGNPNNDGVFGDPLCNNPNDPHAYQGGDLQGVRQRLPAIANLGADAIWITPLYKGVESKVGGNCGFPGYWAAFSEPYQLEIDPRFGMASDFDALLTAAKSKNIKTILDMVVNHAGYGAPLVAQRPDWFHDPNRCSSLGAVEIFCPLAGLPDFNHRVPEAASYLLNLHRQWSERFQFEGIRMDTVKHVEPWYFRDWIAGLKRSSPNLFVFGELLDESSYDAFDPYLQSGFEGLFNFPLRRSLIDTFAKGASVDVAASRIREMIARFGQRQSRWLITLLDNHDVPRFTEEFSKSMSPGVVHERYKLALTALLTLPGIPQLTYGNEVGMYGGSDPDNRRMMPNWAYEPNFHEPNHSGFVSRPGAIWAHTQRLIQLRREYKSLSRGDFDEIWRQNNPSAANVWAFVRTQSQDTTPETDGHSGPVLIVFNNGDANSGRIRLPLRGHFADGQILQVIPMEFDTTSGQLVTETFRFPVISGTVELELKERSALILTTEVEK